ncbi:nucleoside 2-deoxyribosyltransferase [Rhodovarius lipocyclicus]|uniref:nucleoside 2-deoxyribosyltransferase n=1 Tax=Rhodovarius lipocyclicus TaxID=268410 RepID=UPI001359B154|nr:nucleoside 2-deoxyribosyltransferase [Rhodovarius lipocyclicus]
MRIYLAGPDVFFPDAAARAARLKAACAVFGFHGVFPLDPPTEPPLVAPDSPEWQRIFLANEAHIRGCDALVANLTPFRSPSADAGTAWEMGFMRALGRPVLGWTEDERDYAPRVTPDGLQIEDFGLADNLMLHGGALAVFRGAGAFEACLRHLKG